MAALPRPTAVTARQTQPRRSIAGNTPPPRCCNRSPRHLHLLRASRRYHHAETALTSTAASVFSRYVSGTSLRQHLCASLHFSQEPSFPNWCHPKAPPPHFVLAGTAPKTMAAPASTATTVILPPETPWLHLRCSMTNSSTKALRLQLVHRSPAPRTRPQQSAPAKPSCRQLPRIHHPFISTRRSLSVRYHWHNTTLNMFRAASPSIVTSSHSCNTTTALERNPSPFFRNSLKSSPFGISVATATTL